jgi:hypothetical protein
MSKHCVLGLDVSSVAVGVSVLNLETKEIVVYDYVDLEGMEWQARMTKMVDYLEKLNQLHVIVKVFIEEPLVHASGSAFHTAAILQTWAGYVMGACSMIFGLSPLFINVRTARGFYDISNAKSVVDPITKKKIKSKNDMEAKENVYNYLEGTRGYKLFKEYKRTGTIKETTYDRTDALLIALAGVEGCESKKFVGTVKGGKSGKPVKKLLK